MRQRIYFGVESVGGSWRAGILCDESGKILAAVRKIGGVSLYTTPISQEVDPRKAPESPTSSPRRSNVSLVFCELVLELTVLAGIRAEDYDATICFGLTGIGHSYDVDCELSFQFSRDDVLSLLPFKSKRIVCTGDAEIIFSGFAQAENGSAIILNAGSVVLKVADGAMTRYGGWGPAFGDDGSGYDIGRNALRHLSHWHDTEKADGQDSKAFKRLFDFVEDWIRSPSYVGGKFTMASGFQRQTAWEQVSIEWKMVKESFLSKHPLSDLPSALIPFCYGSLRTLGVEKWWSMVSSLIIPIAECWRVEKDEGTDDGPATNLIAEAADRLVLMYKKSTNGQACSPLVLGGGVINHQPQIAKLLQNKLCLAGFKFLEDSNALITVASTQAMRPVVGAVLIALGDASATEGLHWLKKIKMPSFEVVSRVKEEVGSEKWRKELLNG